MLLVFIVINKSRGKINGVYCSWKTLVRNTLFPSRIETCKIISLPIYFYKGKHVGKKFWPKKLTLLIGRSDCEMSIFFVCSKTTFIEPKNFQLFPWKKLLYVKIYMIENKEEESEHQLVYTLTTEKVAR